MNAKPQTGSRVTNSGHASTLPMTDAEKANAAEREKSRAARPFGFAARGGRRDGRRK